MSDLVAVTIDAGVATVSMNRGPVNAIAPDLITELGATFTTLGADADVRVIVLRSAIPGYFMAGADLTVLASGGMTGGDDLEASWAALVSNFDTIAATPKPVIASIAGHALGGGCEMALCCDYRMMADDGRASIGLTETSLGLIPGAGGTQRLPRLIGAGKAMQMILEGTRLRAKDALACGLVDAALPAPLLETAVAEKAAELAQMATRALGLAKGAILDGLDKPLAEGLAGERAAFMQVLGTEDMSEGMAAFFGKRKAVFRGR